MMKAFHHPNVLGLVGVVFKARRPYVLIPYMENGDLRAYLRIPTKVGILTCVPICGFIPMVVISCYSYFPVFCKIRHPQKLDLLHLMRQRRKAILDYR